MCVLFLHHNQRIVLFFANGLIRTVAINAKKVVLCWCMALTCARKDMWAKQCPQQTGSFEIASLCIIGRQTKNLQDRPSLACKHMWDFKGWWFCIFFTMPVAKDEDLGQSFFSKQSSLDTVNLGRWIRRFCIVLLSCCNNQLFEDALMSGGICGDSLRSVLCNGYFF